MGFLRKIARLFRVKAAIQRLPSGSLTVDRDGRVLTSTVSSRYPKELLDEIGRLVSGLFREAREAQMPLTELCVHFGSLLVTARDMRGATIIFLNPQTARSQAPN